MAPEAPSRSSTWGLGCFKNEPDCWAGETCLLGLVLLGRQGFVSKWIWWKGHWTEHEITNIRDPCFLVMFCLLAKPTFFRRLFLLERMHPPLWRRVDGNLQRFAICLLVAILCLRRLSSFAIHPHKQASLCMGHLLFGVGLKEQNGEYHWKCVLMDASSEGKTRLFLGWLKGKPGKNMTFILGSASLKKGEFVWVDSHLPPSRIKGSNSQTTKPNRFGIACVSPAGPKACPGRNYSPHNWLAQASTQLFNLGRVFNMDQRKHIINKHFRPETLSRPQKMSAVRKM